MTRKRTLAARGVDHSPRSMGASAALMSAYDPGAGPDEYFLLHRSGRTVGPGSVLVFTMRARLAHLKETTT